jgi:hypothetical protein
MRFQSAAFRAAAVFAALVVTGCFNQSKNSASASPMGDGAASGSGGGSAASADSQDWSQTVTKPVTDPALNMTAYTVHIPAGWKFTGMIERIPGCHGTQIAADGLVFTALAPDGVTAIEKLPGTTWGWASDGTSGANPKCGPVKINTAAEYLLNIAIPNLRPDAKNISVVPFTPEMKTMLARAQQQAQSNGPQGMKQSVDAARVRLQYTLKGRPVEEILFTTIRCIETDMPAYPMLHRAASERHVCSSTGTAIRRAPQGRLDPLIGKQLPPPEIDSQWDQTIQQRMRQQFAAWQKQNDETFKAIQNHYKELTNGMIQRGIDFQAQQKSSFDNAMAQDRATQGAIDHAAQMQVRDSLNRQLFVDPNTGRKIETSNQFTHNWINSSGDAVALGTDPTADPNGVIDPVRESWVELIPQNN